MQESKTENVGFDYPDALEIRPNQSAGRKILLSIIPLTPAPITGKDAWVGWARLLGYGALSAATYTKSRKISYGLMAATGLSLVSSLAGEAYQPLQHGSN